MPQFDSVNPPPNASLSTARASQWEEIPILKKMIELYKTYYGYLELFPKKDKYALGAKCEQYIIAVLELLLETSCLPKEQKRAVLLQANNKFEMLKVLVRLLKDLKIMDTKKYVVIQTIMQDIGRMLGGWMKTLS